jgi:hypothetical protein
LQVQAPRLFLKGISSAICQTTLLLQPFLMRCSRLQQELMSLMVNVIAAMPTAHPPSALFSFCANQMSGDEGISAFPKDDNLFEWLGTIHGSAGTVYEGLEYKISLKFGPKYPNEPPQVPACTAAAAPRRPSHSTHSANSLRACFTRMWTLRAAVSASISSPLTSGVRCWMCAVRTVLRRRMFFK